MFDDFDTQIQCEEVNWFDEFYWMEPEEDEDINPDEYDDWMAYVYSQKD